MSVELKEGAALIEIVLTPDGYELAVSETPIGYTVTLSEFPLS